MFRILSVKTDSFSALTFDAEYVDNNGTGFMPALEETLMMTPLPLDTARQYYENMFTTYYYFYNYTPISI